MNPKLKLTLLSDIHVAPRVHRPEQRVMHAPIRPQQYVADIVAPARPTSRPEPYARFYRPAAHPDLRKPDTVVVYKTVKVPMPVPFSVAKPAPIRAAVVLASEQIAADALRAAKTLVNDVQPTSVVTSDVSRPTARSFRPKSVEAETQASLVLSAVRDAKPLPRQNDEEHTILRKKPAKKRAGKVAKRTANIMIAIAIVMSGVMVSMIYKYHVALQKVEAKPLNAGSDSKESAVAVAGPAAATVAGIAETKPTVKGGGGGGKLPASTPYKISIPKLKVSANIIGVGITKTGAMSVPGNIWQVGWYKSSATPADNTGVVVVNGHVHGPTQPGVFANLTKLNNGDVVTVSDVSGTSYSYKVIAKQTIKAGEAGDEVLQSGSATKQGLNLITCTGKIVEDKYQDRLVVYTERV